MVGFGLKNNEYQQISNNFNEFLKIQRYSWKLIRNEERYIRSSADVLLCTKASISSLHSLLK